jgi:hypothetical protein
MTEMPTATAGLNAAPEIFRKGRQHSTDNLENHVRRYICSRAFPAGPNTERNGRIEVPSGNMPAGKNHHHERGTDRQRREWTRRLNRESRKLRSWLAGERR